MGRRVVCLFVLGEDMYQVSGTSISMIKGDTFIAEVSLTKDGEAYELEQGDSIRFAMKRTYKDRSCLILKQIDIDSMVLRLEPEETEHLSVGAYVYDIEVTFANGIIDTVISGTLSLLPEVD